MRSLPPLDPDLRPADVIAALRPVLGDARADKLDALAAARIDGVTVVIEDLLDPHNYGAVLRSSEGMGLLRVSTINARNQFRVSTRVTQGCERWLDLHEFTDAESCVRELHAEGYRLLCAVPGAPLSIDELDPRDKLALAFGNEHLGLSPSLRALADGEFRIPMHGASQSLNVSVSAAISLHVVSEARRRALGSLTDLDPTRIELLRARYYASDVRAARMIIDRYLSNVR